MKAFSVYYAIDRKTGDYSCMGIGNRGDVAKLKEQMYSDMSKDDVCAKYGSGAVYYRLWISGSSFFQDARS